MNAIQFLIKEHDKVRKMLSDIDNDAHHFDKKKKLFNELCEDLLRHETMEHKIWYPHFKHSNKLEDTVKHLLSEEKEAEKAIKSFENVDSQEEWENKFSKFKKNVEHHAQEEENKLFPNVKKILSENDLEEIGMKMYQFKEENK